MKLRKFYSKKLHTQIITQTIFIIIIFFSLSTAYVNKSYAICTNWSESCQDNYCSIGGNEYCCTLNAFECASSCGTVQNSGGSIVCLDINLEEIPNWVSCGNTIAGEVCCESACPIIDPPIKPPPPTDPSSYNCGTWSALNNQCEGLDYKVVVGGQKCSTTSNECCNDLSLCSTLIGVNEYVCELNTGICKNTCTSGYEENCAYNGINCTGPSSPTTCKKTESSGVPRPDPQGDCPTEHIDTALGCIPVNQGPFTTAFFRFVVGIAGGLALVVMLIGAIIFMTGGSNPEQVKKGKEIFFGALSGLLFIIFSTVLLRIIAGDIIGLTFF